MAARRKNGREADRDADLPFENWRQRLGVALAPAMLRYRQSVRGLTFGVRAMVLDESGQLLLVKHSYVPGWYLPGGGVEPGESTNVALSRELSEEGGIVLDGSPDLFAIYHNVRQSQRDHVALYVVRRFSQPEPPRPGPEIIGHVWARWTELPDDVTPATRRRVDEVCRGFPVEAEW